MAAAAPMPPRSVGSERPRVAPAGGWSVIPNTYFDHLPRCLSASAYLVVGQILRKTRWGDAVRNDSRDWFSIRQSAMAEKLGMTERGIRKALDEAVESGCLVSRKVGRDLEYTCKVERFPSLKVRQLERSGNPAPGKKTAAEVERLSVALTCPQGLECPVDELVQLDDGTLSNTPLLQTKGKPSKHRNNCSGIEGGSKAKHRNNCSGIEGGSKAKHRNNCSGIRPGVRAIAEQFTPRLGAGPGDDILLEIQVALGEASDEQFATAVAAKAPKVRSYKFLVHVAEDCARTAEAWKRQRAPSAALDGAGECGACGQNRVFDGQCRNCGWSPAA